MSASLLDNAGRGPTSRPRLRTFIEWVASAVRPGDLVLDVGAGEGRNQEVRALAEMGCRLFGVDPDPRVRQNPFL